MQNEPQLSSEMERKLRLLLDETIEDMEGYIETDGKMLYSDALFCRLFDSQKHFLATALEEQRRSYMRQVEALGFQGTEYNVAIADVLALLNGKAQ